MKDQEIKKAIFIGAEWCHGEEALIEAKRISNNFTLKSAPCGRGIVTSYTFQYCDGVIFVHYNSK